MDIPGSAKGADGVVEQSHYLAVLASSLDGRCELLNRAVAHAVRHAEALGPPQQLTPAERAQE